MTSMRSVTSIDSFKVIFDHLLAHIACSMATVVEITSGVSPINWCVLLLSIKSQVRAGALTQNRLAPRKNFRTRASIKLASGIPNLIEELVEMQMPRGMSIQRRYSQTILELSTNYVLLYVACFFVTVCICKIFILHLYVFEQK